jgi:hypothetical protein
MIRASRLGVLVNFGNILSPIQSLGVFGGMGSKFTIRCLCSQSIGDFRKEKFTNLLNPRSESQRGWEPRPTTASIFGVSAVCDGLSENATVRLLSVDPFSTATPDFVDNEGKYGVASQLPSSLAKRATANFTSSIQAIAAAYPASTLVGSCTPR